MTCNFRIGQKVVCIDAHTSHAIRPGGSNWNGDRPQEGEIYTIRDMIPSETWEKNGEKIVHLYFHEIRRGCNPQGRELGYWHVRFRALQEAEDRLATLRAILLDPSRKVSGEEGPVRKRARKRERA